MTSQRNSPILPIVALAILIIVLFILVIRPWLIDTPAELVVRAERDEVFISNNNQLQSLPAPNQTPMTQGEQVGVKNAGWAKFRFGDALQGELLRNGQLIAQYVEPQSELLQMSLNLGTIFNDFNARETVSTRLKSLVFDSKFDNEKYRLGKTRTISTTASGTQFIVAREDIAPLLWVVAIDAAENDLTIAVTDGDQTSLPFPVTTNFARWVAPIGDPSPQILVPTPQLEQWLRMLREGQLQTAEIGDVIWQAANDTIDGDDFQQANLSVLRRGEAVPLLLQNAQGFVEMTLDPDRLITNPVDLIDCNQDGKRDIPIQGNETLRFSFRPTLARVRNIKVEIYNQGGPSSALLQGLDPARRSIGPPVGSTVGVTQTLVTNIDQGVFHFADLKMLDGCLLALALIPPPIPPPPTSPTDTPTPSPTPTVPPTATPTPRIEIVTATPIPTPTSFACIPSNWVVYISQVGDTWNNLGERVSLSVYDLQQANRRNDQLQPGQNICLPFAPPTPTITLTPSATPPTLTSTPTTVTSGPIIYACTPSSIQVDQILAAVNLGTGIDFFCTGRNLRPNEAGFQADLVGPVGTTAPQRFPLIIRGGTETDFQATLPTNLLVGQYDLIVTNPDGRTGIANSIFEVREDSGPIEAPCIAFSSPDYVVNEGDGHKSISLVLNRPFTSSVTISYITSGGTAEEGKDYSAVSGSLTFAPNQTSQSFDIPIINDFSYDPEAKTVLLTLGNPSNVELCTPSSATLVILDNEQITQITNTQGGKFHYSPSLNRDGTRITFASGSRPFEVGLDNSEILLYDTITTEPTQLARFGRSGYPSINADGTRIAFVSGVAPNDGKIVIYNTSSNELETILGPGNYYGIPSISADGTHIVFSHLITKGVTLYNTNTTVTSVIATDINIFPFFPPAINANGTRIAFVSAPSSEELNRVFLSFLYDVNTDTAITSFEGIAPSINADGSLVAFSSFNENVDYSEIFRFNGATITQITHSDPNNNIVNFKPLISAEGSRIIFLSGNPLGQTFKIFLYDDVLAPIPTPLNIEVSLPQGNDSEEGSSFDADSIFFFLSFNGAGDHIAFVSNNDPIGKNADRNLEIFLLILR